MKKIHAEIVINAPREFVFEQMIDAEGYKKWTKIFDPSSYFEGGWNTGDEIKFLSNSEEMKGMGMFAKIAENRKNEFISIQHVGMIKDNIVDTTSPEVAEWVPAYENYSFETLSDGSTKVSVDMDTNEQYHDMFAEQWPKALQALKELCESK